MNTQTQEALKMAIERLEGLSYIEHPSIDLLADEISITINVCNEALEAEQVCQAQEPVSWMYENHNIKKYQEHRDANLVLQYGYQETPLYTHPHQWQGLTAKEIASIPLDEYALQKAEKILKEKNT
jgi:hypothetical protein